MTRKKVNPVQYLALLNGELAKAPGYQSDYRFVFSPPGATSHTAWGVGFEPAEAYARVARDLQVHVDQFVEVVL